MFYAFLFDYIIMPKYLITYSQQVLIEASDEEFAKELMHCDKPHIEVHGAHVDKGGYSLQSAASIQILQCTELKGKSNAKKR